MHNDQGVPDEERKIRKVVHQTKAEEVSGEGVHNRVLKPGHHSTEFWLSIAASVGVALLDAVQPEVKAVVIGSVTALYTTGRALVKMLEGLKR